jgi:hypothetical protein
MAQVNSTPGQNQAAGNLTVVAATSEVQATAAKVYAAAVTVPYAQTEPGITVKILRS